MPGSLDEALKHLEKDHEFLLKGGVFTEDLIETWIGYKRSKEVDPLRLRPHPYEFFLYYDLKPATRIRGSWLDDQGTSVIQDRLMS